MPKGAFLSGAFPLENENCFLGRIIFRCSVFTVSAILIFPGESIFADFVEIRSRPRVVKPFSKSYARGKNIFRRGKMFCHAKQ